MYNITQGLRLKDRVFGDGGCIIYISDFNNVESVYVDTDNKYVSGITMKSTNKFYEFKLPKNNISWINNIEVSVSNACYKYKPSVSFKVPGLKVSRLQLFDFLVRKNVMVIVKSLAGNYWVIGKDLGIDMESGGNFTSGVGGVDLIGSTYNLTGREVSRIYEINPTLAKNVMSDIVYVNQGITLSIGTLTSTSIELVYDWGDYDEMDMEIEMSLDGINYTKIN